MIPAIPAPNTSRPVFSNQRGIHPDLEKVVWRHLCATYRKPVSDASRAAFAGMLARWRGWNPAAPLILDSGCGVGESTVRLACRYPDAFVLGVDQSAHRLARAARNPPDNLLLLRADLVDFWRLLAEAGIRLERHYLLYPNPWPKSEHLKRRWHGHPVLPTLARLGGMLECRSNWRVYLEELACALEIVAGQKPALEDWQEGEAISPFERKYQASGHALFRLRLDLRAADSNPCLTCGACCASYRVDFHPAELAGGPYAWGAGVPQDYAQPLTPRLMRLRGTDAFPPRCLALRGTIGVRVACAIYAERPSPCRDFLPEHEACQRAQRRLGLLDGENGVKAG